jgi:hypothetical protein
MYHWWQTSSRLSKFLIFKTDCSIPIILYINTADDIIEVITTPDDSSFQFYFLFFFILLLKLFCLELCAVKNPYNSVCLYLIFS